MSGWGWWLNQLRPNAILLRQGELKRCGLILEGMERSSNSGIGSRAVCACSRATCSKRPAEATAQGAYQKAQRRCWGSSSQPWAL
jgi:hypothetical protein